MANHGVFVTQTATSVATPSVADSGIPFVIGAAPVQSATKAATANVPVLCTSYSEAVAQLGYSDDWDKYPLCEFMYAHFKVFAAQPVVFCNVLDPSTLKESVSAETMTVSDGKILLPLEAVNDATLVVKSTGGTSATYVLDTDYATYYSGENLVVEVLADGDCASAESLSVAYTAVTPGDIEDADIVLGVEAIDLCMSTVATIPDLICAPGHSGSAVVAAVMATKAENINGVFKAKALIDIQDATTYTEAISKKAANNLTDSSQIVCWPKLTLGAYVFHMSTLLAGLLATTDTGNDGCPYESPSNKSIGCDGMVLADGTTVTQPKPQADMLNDAGILTALNFMGSWVCLGSYTACYPNSTDPKDMWAPISRMFGWVGNTLVRTYWSKLDKPMTSRLIDTVLDSCNSWMNGLTGSGFLLGGRVEFLDDENSSADLMAGKISFHVYMTPPGPAQEIDFLLEYDLTYLSVLTA